MYSTISSREGSISRGSVSTCTTNSIIPLPTSSLHANSNNENILELDHHLDSSSFYRIELCIPEKPPIFPVNYPESKRSSLLSSINSSSGRSEVRSLSSGNPTQYCTPSIDFFLL